MKFQGFGRSKFEALFTSLKNLIEYLLQDEKFLEEVRGSMKMFIKMVKSKLIKNKDLHNKENIFENNISNNYKNFTINYNLVPDVKNSNLLQIKTNDENFINQEISQITQSKALINKNDNELNLALTSKDLSKLKSKKESNDENE